MMIFQTFGILFLSLSVAKDAYLFAKSCYTWEVKRTIADKMPTLDMFDFVRMEITMFKEIDLLKEKQAELNRKFESEKVN